jgi:hypothetical protein
LGGSRLTIRESGSRNPYTHGHEKPDSFIVSKNLSNKSGDNKPQAKMEGGKEGTFYYY